jgi:hypothetical protein
MARMTRPVPQSTRRDFLKLGACAGAAGLGAFAVKADGTPATPATPASKPLDPDLSAVVSDLHVGQLWNEQKFRTDRSYDYINGVVRRLVAEILSMKVLPSYVFGLGDISMCYGEERDYEIAAEILRPLEEAGIKIVMTAGNHDRRSPMARHLGGWLGESPVAGRFASVTHLPRFDMVLLDSLKEPDPSAEDNRAGRGGCELGAEQSKWLDSLLAETTRPTLVCAHHTAWSLGINKQMVKSPRVCGFLHGHNHSWQDNILFSSYGRKTMIRMLGMPSMGMDRDIGYALLRAFDDRLELVHVERDYYFPVQTTKAERLPIWDAVVRERHGRRVFFPFDKLA